jgi:hypothetical protein
MWKAGIIIGIAVFVVIFVASAGVSPLCGLFCVSPLAGVVAGYLAAVFDKPATGEGAARTGAIGGAIGGAGAFLGQAVAGVINALFAPQIAQFARRTFGTITDVSTTRVVAFGWGLCGGLFDIVIMAGMGALFGYVWYRFVGSKNAPAAPPPTPPM